MSAVTPELKTSLQKVLFLLKDAAESYSKVLFIFMLCSVLDTISGYNLNVPVFVFCVSVCVFPF